jgi:hypothetical protein
VWTKRYWQAVAERMTRAAAASLASLLTLAKFNLLNLDWKSTLGAAGGAALYSLLMSLGGSQVGDKGDPALLPAQHYGRHELLK